MSKKVNWGIISTALIARQYLIPAINSSKLGNVFAIASRSLNKAKTIAKKMDIPHAYGSYEELLKNPNIDVIYNPLPNHLHIPITLQAIKNGKHVLCEKPVALNKKEALQLQSIPKKIIFLEAFMVRFHLQWKKISALIKSGKIGEVKAIQAFFSYFNRDAKNIRNILSTGGGAMYDIGCYPTVISNYIFKKYPLRVTSIMDKDPAFKTDRLTSAIYDYGNGKHLTFSVSTQIVKYQRIQILGTKARIEVQIPFNAPINEKTNIFIDKGSDLKGNNIKTIVIPSCDQYQLECDAMNNAILKKEKLNYGVSDAIENMKIIDAVFKAAKSNRWEIIN